MIADYTSVRIYQKKCQYLVKNTLDIYLIFYKLRFSGELTTHLEPSPKLVTEMFDLQK